MISAEDNYIPPPALTNGMKAYVPDLETHVIPACDHRTRQEKSKEVNRLIVDWLKRFPG